MGFLHSWYNFSRKMSQAVLRFKIPVILGLAFCIYWWNTSSIKWWGIIGVGVMVTVTLTILFHVLVRVERKGEDMTAPVNDISEIANDASTVTLVHLARLAKKGMPTEQVIREAESRGIGCARMRIAIAYQKHPFLMQLATLALAAAVVFVVQQW